MREFGFLKNALKGNDFSKEVIEELLSVLDLTEEYQGALSELEAATTDFILGGLKYMTVLPKTEFEELLPVLAKTRELLEKTRK